MSDINLHISIEGIFSTIGYYDLMKD